MLDKIDKRHTLKGTKTWLSMKSGKQIIIDLSKQYLSEKVIQLIVITINVF